MNGSASLFAFLSQSHNAVLAASTTTLTITHTSSTHVRPPPVRQAESPPPPRRVQTAPHPRPLRMPRLEPAEHVCHDEHADETEEPMEEVSTPAAARMQAEEAEADHRNFFGERPGFEDNIDGFGDGEGEPPRGVARGSIFDVDEEELKVCRFDEEAWQNAAQQFRSSEIYQKVAGRKRKLREYSEDALVFQSRAEISAEQTDDLAELDEATVAQQLELAEEEERKAAALGWCFLCRYGQDPFEAEMNRDFARLKNYIAENYGKIKIYTLARTVQKKYNETLREHCPESDRIWSVQTIREHIEGHEYSERVPLVRTLERVNSALETVADHGMFLKSVNGQRRGLDHKSADMFLRLVDRQLKVVQEIRKIDGKK